MGQSVGQGEVSYVVEANVVQLNLRIVMKMVIAFENIQIIYSGHRSRPSATMTFLSIAVTVNNNMLCPP
jgi:hypothetical protein